MKYHQVTLSRGQLSLTYQVDDFTLDDLLDFAERINPKRSFLFVSKVLGRHIPVAPSMMRHAFEVLSDKLPDNLPEPILVMGMAETAVGLAAGVHQRLQTRYRHAILLNSTRHQQVYTQLGTFSEERSHASTHLIYLSDESVLDTAILHAKTLIMVDDEASTGKTCDNLVKSLIQSGLTKLEQVHLTTLVDWSLSAKHHIDDALPYTFYRHHLLSGSWTWLDTPNDNPIQMPDVATTQAGNQPIADLPSFGRTPTLDSTLGLGQLWRALPDTSDYQQQKILVLGSNEFVWLPFLLAERLEQAGAWVKFSALTRSPIALGGAIHDRLSFSDNYGLGMTNFVYNVNFDAWDKIFLCIETPPDSVDASWQHPKVMIISPFNPIP